MLARKPLCATRSTETRVWYFVYYCGGLAGTAVLGWIFDSFGWAACVSGVGLALAMAALLIAPGDQSPSATPVCTGPMAAASISPSPFSRFQREAKRLEIDWQ